MKYVVKDEKGIFSNNDNNEATLEIKKSSQGGWGIFSDGGQLMGKNDSNVEFDSEDAAKKWIEKNYKVIKKL